MKNFWSKQWFSLQAIPYVPWLERGSCPWLSPVVKSAPEARQHFFFLYPLPREFKQTCDEPEPESRQNLALQNLVESQTQATIIVKLGNNEFAISKVFHQT